MVLKVSEVSGSLDRYHEEFEGAEGFLRASFPSFGETFVGGMALRSKRSVSADSPTSSCGSSLSVASVISTSPSKSSVLSASSVCSMPIPVVPQKKYSAHADKGNIHTWIDAMRAQSPPHYHGDTVEAFDIETTIYNSWLVSTFPRHKRHHHVHHTGELSLIGTVGVTFWISCLRFAFFW